MNGCYIVKRRFEMTFSGLANTGCRLWSSEMLQQQHVFRRTQTDKLLLYYVHVAKIFHLLIVLFQYRRRSANIWSLRALAWFAPG